MVTKVIIKDNTNTPLHYLPDLPNFKNGKEYIFKTGVNIIVGENGCGKTTLLKLIERYLMVEYSECNKGEFNSNINKLFRGLGKETFFSGADVYADYVRNTFRLSHVNEKTQREALKTFNEFGTAWQQANSSTGEGVAIALNYLFNFIFGGKASLKYDYSQFKENYPQYYEYTQSHKIKGDEWTILMDEPDRNLSLDNIEQIKSVLDFHKENTQIIATIHNPLLIYSLSYTDANFIELTEGYIKKVREKVNHLVNGGTKKMKNA